jgi:hypothetical protein
MSDKPQKPGEKFGLDIPFEEALERFAKVTKEEVEAAAGDGEGSLTIRDGETDDVPFKGTKIRRVFHESEWWFSIVDVVGSLTETTNANRLWSDIKRQMVEKEGFSELYDEIVKLNMPGKDGKQYPTDAANPETLFRIIQSIRSPRAEPFKRWLARVGYERIKEVQNPEIAIKRAVMASAARAYAA